MKKRIWFLAALVLLAAACVPNAFAQEITIIGQVTDNQNIVTEEGIFYEVALTDLGDELLLEHEGEMVEVRGTVEEKEGLKIITVLGFSVHEE